MNKPISETFDSLVGGESGFIRNLRNGAKGFFARFRENIAELGIQDRATVVQGSTITALSKFEADIYFLDPPYTIPRRSSSCLPARSSCVSA